MELRKKEGAFRSILCCWIFLLGAALFLPPAAISANAGVSGRYIRSDGDSVLLEISVSEPSPSSIIVMQHLPSEVEIVTAQPPFKKYDPKKGEAKWFFKEDISSSFFIEIHLSGPVESGEVTGEVRYMDPARGDMVTIFVKPVR